MKLAIIIPAYNEEKRITNTLEKIEKYLATKKIQHEIIIIDDGSKDRTIATAQQTKVKFKLLKNPENKGKGYSVKQGMLNANADYFLFTDADLSTPIEELANFLPWLEQGFDVVIGSRAVAGADVQTRQPIYRELIGKVFNKIVRVLTVRGIKDTQCGFKLFTSKAAKEIFPKQTLNRFCFDVEVLQIAKIKGYKIKELPVVWRNAEGSKVSPIKDSLRMLRDLVKIRWNSIRGIYD